MIIVYFVKNRSYYFFDLRVYLLFEYTILIYFFYELLRNKLIKKLLLLTVIPFFIFAVINYFNTDPNTFNNLPVITEFLTFMIIIIVYLFEKMNIVTAYPLIKSISFWLCVGLFIYFTGNFFYLVFITSGKDAAFVKQMKVVYSIINISKDIILSLAWFAHERIETKEDELRIPDEVHLDDDLSSFTTLPNP